METPSNPSALKSQQILAQLNPAQQEAVLHGQGPLVVFAGAGSGKTRVIISRVAYLLTQGVWPSQILAVTFTNKAAREMRERLVGLTPDAPGVHIATFHAACARWLREFAEQLGFQSDFSIYDDKDALNALKTVLTDLNLPTAVDSANEYKQALSKAKTLGLLPEDCERLQGQPGDFLPRLGAAVYRRYQEYLAKCNAMDFGDLLLNMLLLLRRDKAVAQKLQRRYRYILVDEYQDTNPTQFQLIELLLNAEQNLCVVGDDDQSIYSWRGARPNNIIDFTRYFPTAKLVRLEQNYRCTRQIIAAASALIQNNQVRASKTLWTANPDGPPLHYELCSDGEIEALSVVSSIRREEKLYPFSEVAIFYRTNAQSRPLEEQLRRYQIPYRIYGALRFYDRAEIKDVLAYLRILVNPDDEMAFQRILATPPRGLGPKALAVLQEYCVQHGLSSFAGLEAMVATKGTGLPAKFTAFHAELQLLKQRVLSAPLGKCLSELLQLVPYKEYLQKKVPDQAADKIANLHELGAALADYQENFPEASLSEWLREVALSGSENEAEGGLSLMTLHSAKGLEFSRVYLVGLEDGLLPHSNSLDLAEQLEEERRLFYVGLTRARQKLSLFAARKRRLFQNWVQNKPSRFLKELPAQVFEQAPLLTSSPASGAHSASHAVTSLASFKSVKPAHAHLQVGCFVSHPTFGKGVIEELDSAHAGEKAVVNFKDFGKRLIALHHLKQIAFLN